VGAPGFDVLRVRNATPWLATAGAGDALAGILGALLGTHPDAADLAPLAATAAWIHGEAARRASDGGPFTVLDLCAAIPGVVRDLASMSA
jgi:NAD(P)H-hydrate repair Nnr-like enzyme with NAD(P)H-hydrate dehydratase domain